MALYEYKCNTCGKHFEYRQSMKDDALSACPESVCEQAVKGKGEVTRLISKNIGLVFKGSGFYLTDYKHQNGSSAVANGSASTNGNMSNKDNTSSEKETKTETADTAKNEANTLSTKTPDSA